MFVQCIPDSPLPILPTARRLICFLFCALAAAGAAFPAAAQDAAPAQTIWRLLDYMSVDYPGAVADGTVINASEFAEMNEFAGQVRTRMEAMPATSAKAGLVVRAAALQRLVGAHEDGPVVTRTARALAADLIVAYPVPLAPTALPDRARGAALYAENCSSCHGVAGRGDGSMAAQLDPHPIAFTDASRARQRSPFALYQVIDQGIDGTAMPSFAHLSAQDRWDLAYYVGAFAFTDVTAGERIWTSTPALHGRVPDLKTLSSLTAASLDDVASPADANAVVGYLRTHPETLTQSRPLTLDIARQKLRASLQAYQAGQHTQARDLALAAYLDGIEPVEPVLAARAGALKGRIEVAMGGLRSAMAAEAPLTTVQAQVRSIESLLDEADGVLAPDQATGISSFVGAFTILLREGLEALLIVVAILAFLKKAERPDMLRYVHGGWTSALAAGALTWAVATFFIGVSGASRELTEGFGSLFAAVVLLSVGIWMHGKSQADAWQRYIREKLTAVLTARSAWVLFGFTFVVVYREVFETILFYATLWAQGNGGAVLAGAGSAIVVLAAIGWTMLRYSRTLPIGTFFAYSSALIAVLAVVLSGKGVAALQEAGLISVNRLAGFPSIDWLGVSPTREGVIAQVATGLVVAVGFWLNSRPRKPQIDAGDAANAPTES